MNNFHVFRWLMVAGVSTLFIGCSLSDQEQQKVVEPPTPVLDLSNEVASVLDRKIHEIKSLMNDKDVLDKITSSNNRHQLTPKEKFLEIDQEWRSTVGINTMVKPYLFNDCSKKLSKFQESTNGFSEIVITNRFGASECLTHKSNNFYQGDKEWWQKSFSQGKGLAHFGKLEYDENINLETIAIYVPMMDNQNHEVIGVAKAIIDVTAIKKTL